MDQNKKSFIQSFSRNARCVLYIFANWMEVLSLLYQSESNQSINILSVSMSTFRAVLTFYFRLFIKKQLDIYHFFWLLLSFITKVLACTVKVESIKKSNVCPVDDVTLEPPVSLQSTLFSFFRRAAKKVTFSAAPLNTLKFLASSKLISTLL